MKTYEIPSFFFNFILTFRKNLERKVFSIARQNSAWLNFWEPSQTLAIPNYWKAKLSNSPSLDLLEFPPLDVFHNFCDDFLDEISGCFFFLKFLFKKKNWKWVLDIIFDFRKRQNIFTSPIGWFEIKRKNKKWSSWGISRSSFFFLWLLYGHSYSNGKWKFSWE